jgi:hypothetical protein
MVAGLGCSGGAAKTADGGTGVAGSSGGAGAAGTGGSAGSGGAPSNSLYGTFTVKMQGPPQSDPGMADVQGKISDGPTPLDTVWEQASKEGGCTLLTPRIPFCDPKCEVTVVCVQDGKCQAPPTALDLGAVTVSGLKIDTGASEFTVIANKSQQYYSANNGTKVAFPPCEEGTDVSIQVAGGNAPFSTQTKCIAPLVQPSDTLTVDKNIPLALTWTPPGKAGVSRIQVMVDLSHHGGIKGKIECDVADTGSLTISAALMTQLINLGLAGFPEVSVTRSSIGSTAVGLGHVDVDVVAENGVRLITIPGLISCNDTTECPMGKICQSDLTCK